MPELGLLSDDQQEIFEQARSRFRMASSFGHGKSTGSGKIHDTFMRA